MKLRKYLGVLLTASILCFLLSAQAFASSKNTLWRIKTKNNTIYLAGSIHLLKKENYPLNDALEKAFKDSKVLVLETDIDKMKSPDTQQMMLTRGILKGTATLDGCLSKKTYAKANMKAQEVGLNMTICSKFKPWLFAVTIAAMKLQALGFSEEYGLDSYFFKKAKNSNKQVIGLETPVFMLDLFDNLSAEYQEEMVKQTIEDLDIIENQVEEIINAWSSGDIKAIQGILLKSFDNYPEIYNKFICQRNRNWMRQIEPFLKDKKSYMIVVGAGHIPGENGLIELIKNRGYTPEQL